MKKNISSDYRADIDGLRALAIVSVILFHLDKTLLPGGFTGVDIFFVISGFLITSHIINDTLKGTFTFKKFYIRRIKRILPALLGVIIFVLVGSFIIFTQFYFEKTGMESVAAILSFSNIYFFTSSGYFDDNVIFKPLLHTWSLGVEEQFYLLWPMLILLFLNFNKLKNIIWFFLILGIISFILNYIFLTSREAIFYLVPFRVFEFTSGAFVAYVLIKQDKNYKTKYRNILSTIGLILIIYPFFMLDENDIFPFYNALFTIIGTGLIIYTKDGYINKLLSLKFFVWIGLISYSLYLYHWPSIVFISYLNDSKLDTSLYIYILLLTIILSLLSYFYIEKKFRYMENKKSLKWISTIAIILLLISSLILNDFVKSIPSNKSELISPEEFSNAKNKRYSLVNTGCKATELNNTQRCNMMAPLQIMTMGNSHALDAYNIIYQGIKDNQQINLIHFRTTTGCGYELKNKKVTSTTNECTKEASLLSNPEFINKIDILVINYFKFKTWGFGYISIIDFIRKQNPNMKIIVIGSYIGLRPNKCFDLINTSGSYDACVDPKNVTHTGDNDLRWIMSQNFTKENFLYIDTLKLLCGESKKLHECTIKIKNGLVFYDGDHFSLEGASLLGEKAWMYYENELNKFGVK